MATSPLVGSVVIIAGESPVDRETHSIHGKVSHHAVDSLPSRESYPVRGSVLLITGASYSSRESLSMRRRHLFVARDTYSSRETLILHGRVSRCAGGPFVWSVPILRARPSMRRAGANTGRGVVNAAIEPIRMSENVIWPSRTGRAPSIPVGWHATGLITAVGRTTASRWG